MNMTQRIRELAEQSTINIGDEFHPIDFFDKEKFAELIVRECAELTLDHKNDNYYNGWLDYRDEIRRHFGVGE
jgi:hypothetical protein